MKNIRSIQRILRLIKVSNQLAVFIRDSFRFKLVKRHEELESSLIGKLWYDRTNLIVMSRVEVICADSIQNFMLKKFDLFSIFLSQHIKKIYSFIVC